jgi:Gas vesicle synthesis protein GvpL/GvpF
VIHVYGFVSAPAPVPPVVGLDGAPVEAHVLGPVAAVVSRHPDGPAATQDAVLRHAEVVEAAMRAAGAVLPARFGAGYPDEKALGLAVRERAHTLRDGLERVRGCVELGVRVLAPEPEGRPPADGAAYMQSRLRETAERRWIAAWVHGALSEQARESTFRVPHEGRTVLVASYLVPERSQEAFERRVQELAPAREELAFFCTGPWPPYSFVEAV